MPARYGKIAALQRARIAAGETATISRRNRPPITEVGETNMNCRNIQPLLSEYIDNVLSARDTWEVDKHLAECNGCARVVNQMRQTVRLLAESDRFEVGT